MIFEFLAEGFEEIEALSPVDVLRRAGLEVSCVKIGDTNSKIVIGAHGISVCAEMFEKEALELSQKKKIDMIIFPGGMPGARNLDESPATDVFIRKAMSDGAYIAAICAAPMILGKRGLLAGKRATCYPGFEEYLTGAVITGEKVTVSEKIITACGPGAAFEFAFMLTALMKGEAAAEDIRSAMLAK